MRYSLIPPYPLWRVAEVYTLGSRKYDDHNWRKGRPASDWIDGAERHLAKYKAGEDFDPDGQHHLASVVFHAFALMEQEVTFPDLDDRYKDGAQITREVADRFIQLETNDAFPSGPGDGGNSAPTYELLAAKTGNCQCHDCRQREPIQ